MVAATLAARGLDVVVVEAAGYFNESDFSQLELPAYQQMFWRGGPTPTAEGNVTLQAGTTLGGGTTINWTNCLRTKPWVREQWASEHQLEGLDGAEFDAHLDAVWERLGVNADTSDLNGPQQRMQEGCEALGWSFSKITRNADPSGYAPESAAYMGFGDQSGSKQSADRTWLADAQASGAKLLAHTRVQRILVEDGRAAGVEAEWATPDGRGASVTVRAPRVVVAAGSLESPALLARSEIGGPAVGQNLRLHPCTAVLGVYGSDQEAWWGPPQAGLCDEFVDTGDGYGMLIETGQYAPGLVGSATPWTSGADHKERMENFRFGATFISLTRDHGGGSVVTDPNGEAIPLYSVDRRARRREPAQGPRRPGPPARGGRGPHDRRAGGERADVAARRRLRVLRRRHPADPVPRRRPQDVQRPPDGHLPDGPRPVHLRRGPPRRAARHPRRVDRRRERVPDLLGDEPDDHDHGAGAPHGRGDRRRRRCRRALAEAEEVTVGN